MMAKEKEIGDPLENVARTGKLGGRAQTSKSVDFQKSEMVDTQKAKHSDIQPSNISESRKSESLDIQNVEILEVQTSGPLNAYTSESVKGQNVNSLAVQTSKGTHKGRTQKTIYLPPPLAKRLNFAAVEEEREISEIVTDALEAYFKNKEKGNN